MDLKVVKNGSLCFIHFINLFTRFSRAQVIHRKTTETVVNAFITSWTANGLGAPRKVLVDNGGEFDNPLYLEAMEQYNIEVCTIGASSPWSNGTCERNHAVIDFIVDKMLEEDPKMKIEVALADAISAKNSVQNHLGFTPIQLVTDTLLKIPSILNSDLPALEEADSNVVNMYAVQRAFVKAESSDKIMRALRHPVRVSEAFFENGEKVFYKRDDGKRWHGLGKVVGQLGTVVFVIHGSRLIRCTSCHVIKAPLSNASNEKVIKHQLINM